MKKVLFGLVMAILALTFVACSQPADKSSFTNSDLSGLYAVVYEGETFCYFDFKGNGCFNQRAYWQGRPGAATRSYRYEIRNGNELYTYLVSDYSDEEFEYYGTLSMKGGRLYVELAPFGETIELVRR